MTTEAEGIDVVELNLNLPNTYYYLQWASPAADGGRAARRGLLQAVREAGRRHAWTIFAAGCDPDTLRLLFKTAGADLDDGLASLPGHVLRRRLYLVQAETALAGAARHAHGDGDLPDVHYGLFMGEPAWADRMLTLLTRCALGAVPNRVRPRSLAEIAGQHADNRQAIAAAFRSGRFSLKDIAEHFDMHFSDVSAVINANVHEGERAACGNE